ncbi:Vitamin B12-binding protein [Thalassocella blandensis]|nr:Vitamin B12-binding protein [Thalassocella blandensis]
MRLNLINIVVKLSCAVLCIVIPAMKCVAEINVTDFAGHTVTLSKPAQRIVALAPHIVENIFTAGAGDRLVGVVDYCDYPPQAKSIENVGAISAFSLEKIIALKPDLVIVWYSGNAEKYIDKFKALGIPAYASDPQVFSDVAKTIRDYGKLAGTEKTAEQEAERFLARYDFLNKTYSQKSKVSVFYQVWNDPLQTINGGRLISNVIQMCGGHNIFADEKSMAPKVSLEAVISRNPEVIIASGMGEEKPEWLEDWRRFNSLTAVQKENLFFVPPDVIQRHTVRILSGAQMMCEQLELARHRRQ